MPMRIVFLGTPDFAVPTLDAIIAAGHDVPLVVTQPDRPKGRKQELIPSPLKAAALRHEIEVFQPNRIREPQAIEKLTALRPDAMVVVGYGQIIPQSIIDIAPLGIINVHASLLPELRGAAPIQWSIVRGYKTTGVTTMQIDAGLDTGDILLQSELPICPEETAPELSARLAQEGATLLIETLCGAGIQPAGVLPSRDREGAVATLHPESQDNSRATWAPIIRKEDGRIDWTHSAQQIHDLVRGFQPWPGAHTSFRGQSIHLWKTRVSPQHSDLAPGTLITNPGIHAVAGAGVYAVAGNGALLELLEVQLEGRKRMPAAVFANGHRLTPNERLAN